MIADTAREALALSGFSPLVICGDGAEGYRDAAPYDRILATASVREIVPRAWLDQTRPGGLIVTPWGTDYCNGVMLTLRVADDHTVTGRFSEDLAFMRLRSQRRCCYEPDEIEIQHAGASNTEVHGLDFFRMINSDQAAFVIGLRVPHCSLIVRHLAYSGNWHRTFSCLAINPIRRTVLLQKKSPNRTPDQRTAITTPRRTATP